jgi:hypothetical protein
MNSLPKDLVEVIAMHLEDDERVALYRCNRLMASAQGRARWTWRIHSRTLPRGCVTWLAVDDRFYTPFAHLPPSLTRLEVLSAPYMSRVLDAEHMPWLPHLTDLSLAGLSVAYNVNDFHWAPHVSRLVMPRMWNPPRHALACISDLNHLHTLDMGDAFDETLSYVPWSASLTTLRLGHAFHRPLDDLPVMLRNLVVGDSFNQSISTTVWPETLVSIKLGDAFNRSLHGLPRQLLRLHMGRAFRRNCVGVVWPTTLVELSVPDTSTPGLPAFATSRIRSCFSSPPSPSHKQPLGRPNVLYKGKNRLLPVVMPYPLSIPNHTSSTVQETVTPKDFAETCVIC